MSNETKKPTTLIVEVNWEGLKRFLGWKGTIEDLKRLELPKMNTSDKGGSRE